jgi:hypothetical protein
MTPMSIPELYKIYLDNPVIQTDTRKLHPIVDLSCSVPVREIWAKKCLNLSEHQ